MDNKLAHRDDLPMDVVAALEEKMAELYPGYKVVFAGDAPADKQPDMTGFMEALVQRAASSFADGTCIDCGAKMPNYNPLKTGWKPSPGWCQFEQVGSGAFMGWCCQTCDEAEDDGKPRPVNID